MKYFVIMRVFNSNDFLECYVCCETNDCIDLLRTQKHSSIPANELYIYPPKEPYISTKRALYPHKKGSAYPQEKIDKLLVISVLLCVAGCCSVLQCVAVYCSVLQSDAVHCSVLQ